MSKIHDIMFEVRHRANLVADRCIALYNNERLITNVHIAITLDDLKIKRLSSVTRTTVLSILRTKGFESVRYDNVTQTFRGYLSFPNIVFETRNAPLKPVTLKTPLLRTMMGDVYRQQG